MKRCLSTVVFLLLIATSFSRGKIIIKHVGNSDKPIWTVTICNYLNCRADTVLKQGEGILLDERVAHWFPAFADFDVGIREKIFNIPDSTFMLCSEAIMNAFDEDSINTETVTRLYFGAFEISIFNDGRLSRYYLCERASSNKVFQQLLNNLNSTSESILYERISSLYRMTSE